MARPSCTCTEFPCNCPVIKNPAEVGGRMDTFYAINRSDERRGGVVPRVHIVKAGEHTYKISDGKEYILRNIRGGGEPYWQEIK